MTDRFDLEQGIMECWRVCEDINLLYEGVMEKDMTNDEIANVLIGLNILYNLKFEKMYDQFSYLITTGNIK